MARLPGFLGNRYTPLSTARSVVRRAASTAERFEKVVLVHGVRGVSELAYRELITCDLSRHELLGDMVRRQLVYVPTATREAFERQGRITRLIDTGQLARELAMPELAPATDRVMICGSQRDRASPPRESMRRSDLGRSMLFHFGA